MKPTTLNLYTYSYKELKTYLTAFAFSVCNLIFPQLAHQWPQGGLIWLPIYFFTLIAAYKYGWKTGLLTAVCSPLLNSQLFGMPAANMLPVILFKSVMLALTAGFTAQYFQKLSVGLLIGVIAVYQLTGTAFEWALTGSLTLALQDLKLGYPGLLLQVFGGYLFIKYLIKK